MELKFGPQHVVPVAKRAFFLAYNAINGTTGLGFLQAKAAVTDEQVWQHVCHDELRPYGDYVFGRMMKMGCTINLTEGTIEVRDVPPRHDYQGWSGTYPTYASVFEAAAKELGVSQLAAA